MWLLWAGVILLVRSEEHTSELQSHRDLHSFPTRRSSDLVGWAALLTAYSPLAPVQVGRGLGHVAALGRCDFAGVEAARGGTDRVVALGLDRRCVCAGLPLV